MLQKPLSPVPKPLWALQSWSRLGQHLTAAGGLQGDTSLWYQPHNTFPPPHLFLQFPALDWGHRARNELLQVNCGFAKFYRGHNWDSEILLCLEAESCKWKAAYKPGGSQLEGSLIYHPKSWQGPGLEDGEIQIKNKTSSFILTIEVINCWSSFTSSGGQRPPFPSITQKCSSRRDVLVKRIPNVSSPGECRQHPVSLLAAAGGLMGQGEANGDGLHHLLVLLLLSPSGMGKAWLGSASPAWPVRSPSGH